MKNYPSFSGTNVYAAAESVGVVQVSSPKAQGSLVYSGRGVEGDATLLITAKKHPSDVSTAVWGLAVDWTDGVETNALGSVNLGADYEEFALPLEGVGEGGFILIHPSDATKTGRRILIDRVLFVSGYLPAYSEIVPLEPVYLVAPPGQTSRRMRNLERNGLYRATVTAFGENGAKSDASDAVYADLDGHDLGFSVIIK